MVTGPLAAETWSARARDRSRQAISIAAPALPSRKARRPSGPRSEVINIVFM
jgi:hypothetical protein